MPGTLPVLNKAVLAHAARLGFASRRLQTQLFLPENYFILIYLKVIKLAN